jgi:hypothetical protein
MRRLTAVMLFVSVIGTPQFGPQYARGDAAGADRQEARGHLRNGAPWPANFRPYGSGSFWNIRVTNTKNPKLLDRSDEIVALVERNDRGAWIHTLEAGAGWDEGHPIVIASNRDPIVHLRCTKYCDLPFPSRIHIPPNARPGSGGDAHLAIVQPNGTEIDTWGQEENSLQAPEWKNGSTLAAANIVDCGNFYTGPGRTPQTGASTVGGACLAGGIIHYNELMAGNINHAIFLGIACAAGHTHVFPAVQDEDARCTGSGPHAPIGSHVWLDLPDSRIDALPILDWEKTLLRAMHQYGGYVMDTAGCQAANCPAYADSIMNFMLAQEVDVQYVAFGAPSPWVKYASTHGWNGLPVRARDGRYKAATRWVFKDNWDPLAAIGGWNTGHFHILDPCYASGSC